MIRTILAIKPVLFCLLLTAAPALAEIPLGVDVVVLGEVHDNPDAHLGQAAALTKLKPQAVVFEMLSAEDAKRANAERNAIRDIWADLPWPDYSIYKPVFDALGDAVIVGAAVPRSTIRSVYDDGAAAVFGDEAQQFGLDIDLPQSQQDARETMQFDAHCRAMPRDLMAGMVEVQRFRDARFAKAALDALETYGSPVAIVTGNGHARLDWGIPAVIKNAAPNVKVFSIAYAEAEGGTPFDKMVIVPEASRTDPCRAFETK